MIDTLSDLLNEYSQASAADRPGIQDRIWTRFGVERTVLVWDMSGFSLLSRRHGIVHYLSMVRRMQETTRPVVVANGGSIIKYEADNGFAVFPDPDSGVRAAIAMNAALKLENARQPDEFHIRIACGLDHGNILFLEGVDEGHDFYGNAVNTASKLGEDLAEPGEVLLTKPAFERIPSGVDFTGKEIKLSISGLDLDVIAIDYAG